MKKDVHSQEALSAEIHAAITLQLIDGLSLASRLKLFQHFKNFSSVLSAPVSGLAKLARVVPPSAVKALSSYQQNPEAIDSQARNITDWCAENHVSVVALGSEQYPALLKEIPQPPTLLFVKGDSSLLSLPQVAIVGSRNATTSGLNNASEFARILASSGFAVTSGLAMGIDGAAHQGALEGGKTIAVVGTGIDVIYPHQHQPLYQQIIESGGAIVSEFLPGMPPLAQNFPRRNRIISGLSLGVLVVEAAQKSGSLITARLAMEQNREVFAIPGSIHNTVSKGCHQLLRQGATLVETAADIVEQLGGMLNYLEESVSRECATSPENTLPEHQVLLEFIGFDPVDMDTLIARTGMPVADLNQQLMALELDGLVENKAGQYLRVK